MQAKMLFPSHHSDSLTVFTNSGSDVCGNTALCTSVDLINVDKIIFIHENRILAYFEI